jgi:acetyltransferase-like isoleucine patch superfamily enzyme
VLTTTHALGSGLQRAGDTMALPVHVGVGAWIGAGAVVLPGVTVGAGAVVAAGAVVTEDLEPHGLYAGIPAEVRRMMTPDRWVP